MRSRAGRDAWAGGQRQCGLDADSFEDIALWGRLKTDWLRRFLVLKNGIPSQDTFLRVFRVLDPKQFETVFRRWVGGIVGALDGVLAVDGKTLRRSADGDAPPVHMVSAFSTELGLVLGQEKGLASSHNPCIHCLCCMAIAELSIGFRRDHGVSSWCVGWPGASHGLMRLGWPYAVAAVLSGLKASWPRHGR